MLMPKTGLEIQTKQIQTSIKWFWN